MTPEQRYLELLKKALAFTLWPEPPVPIETFDYHRSPIVRRLLSLLSRLLAFRRLHLVKERSYGLEEREEGRIWPMYAQTMVGLKRLDNLQDCVETVLREGVEGDLIETGVWRGGSCIFMRGILAVYGDTTRKVYVADSFEGLPAPDPSKYSADRSDRLHQIKYLAVSQAEVEANFANYGLLDGQVVFLKGWFKDTLPRAEVQKLAVMRLDGDMYESTMDALGNLYPKLSPGGFCIIDDYALAGCRAAVDDFRASEGISEQMQAVDWTGVYWRKG
ncbi:MAG: TylF/MycF family methyltransferase [Desulfarculus sp.]|nr:TylF/MycF family methyltransferase [Pseudomonadota bacterium]MBV1717627.1 TylF/MycF family methyltransferase [Desulfarculus sp.]MBU4576487.1 TylF/MycF family methyltransferase [Pseudomonadota bacterium]MBU4599168.1 TylF/MycF family methyltransferase [Pseudomonadota bacterium]MBV1739779.1 TylF/MycF family methyltransferase [Desulfarculus sp.]